jgi:hypothetical protein
MPRTVGSAWRTLRQRQIEHQHVAKEANTEALRAGGVFFTTHNDGLHLVVMDRWDFWPSTGRFTERKARPGQSRRRGKGVLALLQHIEEDGDGTTAV